MRILVLGAAGMIGRKLVRKLVDTGTLAGRQIAAIDLFDVVLPEKPGDGEITFNAIAGDIADAATVGRLVNARPDLIFHLAAVVSGEAEADLEKGYRINLDGTRNLLEAVRAIGSGYCPRVVFTSSLAVFGAPLPDVIPDDFQLTPLSSYGTQKAIGELLLADYSRRGIIDGVGLRLPTIVVRPGKPNKAASSFYSAIIREPLAGQETTLPVGEDLRHWVASPRSAIGFVLHAAAMDTAPLGARRCLTMPGVAVSVGGMIETLRRFAGDEAVALIRKEPDPVVAGIVSNWPRAFATERAAALGFTADADFDAVVQAYMDDEMQPRATA